MIRKSKGALQWLEFELLAQFPEVSHAVFLRHGGASEEPFSSLNVLHRSGDTLDAVYQNHSSIQNLLQIDRLLYAHQVHGNTIRKADYFEREIPQCDGLMTHVPGYGLMAMHADCQAALFYDPINRVVAAVHAGWRGQVQNIYNETVKGLCATYGTNPKDLFVCISPSLGPQNSEFKNYKRELPQEFWQFQIKPTYFNLWEISRYQLETCGIPSDQIQIAEMDTYENECDFFSYRRERARGRQENITGGHGTVIALRV
jgi:YfiH family protein